MIQRVQSVGFHSRPHVDRLTNVLLDQSVLTQVRADRSINVLLHFTNIGESLRLSDFLELEPLGHLVFTDHLDLLILDIGIEIRFLRQLLSGGDLSSNALE